MAVSILIRFLTVSDHEIDIPTGTHAGDYVSDVYEDEGP